jgi:thiol-disulfide isomerase/thioredoxin
MKTLLTFFFFTTLVGPITPLESNMVYTAYVFLGVECPISQKYIPTLNELTKNQQQLNIVGVFSGDLSSEDLSQFTHQYKVNFEVIPDPNFKLANRYSAAVTPEVFLVDKGGEVLYSGAIDNWFVSLGRNRLAPSEYYLLDALISLLEGREVEVSQTPAIGCFIERHKPAAHAHH